MEVDMPRGVTPTRVRRRQSDAKWRASVAMCYNIMKNVIPNQKKLGRRKVSKALTLKETERHIVSLERKLKELIEERAPMCGKVIMIEKEDNCLAPVTFDDIRQDFAAKQHALFMCTTTGGKKRYNVPSDIEASLDQLSQQTCDLVAMDRKEAEVSFPHLLGAYDSQRLKSQTTLPNEGKLQSLLKTPADDVSPRVSRANKTPAKKQPPPETRVIVCSSEERETTGSSTRNSTLKACKQLPFGCKLSRPRSASHIKPVSLLSGRNGLQATAKTSHTSQMGSKSSPRISSPSSDLTSTESPLASTKLTSGKSLLASTQTSRQACNQASAKSLAVTCKPASGFTPVKLPYGLDNGDPMMTFPGTPAKSAISSPFGCLSIPETPGSCFNGVEYFELSDEEDVASLLCTESIDSMDLDMNFTDRSPNEFENKDSDKPSEIPDIRCETEEGSARRKTPQAKVRRRLDKDYECSQDQMVPTPDKSCLEFDGYLLFHQHSAALMGPDCSQSEKALNTAHMWEKLEEEDRALYARMASLDQSEDSNDLSADLLSIDLKPLHKEHLGMANKSEDSQEVPSLVLDLSEEMHEDFQPHFIEGYEDLGVFYHNDVMKEDMSNDATDGFGDLEQQNQVVPQMG